MRAGVWLLDSLHVSQLVAQEAMRVMAAAMIWQQGTMQEVSAWELDVEDAMREMERVVQEGESDLYLDPQPVKKNMDP